ncbi:MAG: TadE/TadG family type IV pilus assembly protein [Pseudomonadota bacterium]
MMSSIKKRKKQQGIAAVEMVVVLPVFLLLLAIVIEISNILIEYSILTRQQQVAARYLSEMHKFKTLAEIQNIGKDLVVFNSEKKPILRNLTRNDVKITVLNTIIITTNYPYKAIIFPTIPNFSNLSASGINTEFNLRASIEVTRL